MSDYKVVLSDAELNEQIEMMKLGLQSKVRAIMAIYGIDREEAQKLMDEIYEENQYS